EDLAASADPRFVTSDDIRIPERPIMRQILLHLDSSMHPSVFDRCVAIDAGVEAVLSYGNVTENAVRDLVHGVIFTRGPKELHTSAIFSGGSDVAVGERLLAAVRTAFFGPFSVSVMLDSNGCNTTAAAAFLKVIGALGDPTGRPVVIIGGTGPVGMRLA